MRKELFDELLESVREAGAIMRGELKPSRMFYYPSSQESATHQDNGRKKLLQRIIFDRKAPGAPRIKRTRVSVSEILDSLAEGMSPDEIIERYPSLKHDDIRAAAAYASEMMREAFAA